MTSPEAVEKKVLDRIRQVRALHARLLSEGESELASKIKDCGMELQLTCVACKKVHMGRKRCKKKWCPRCCAALTAERNNRMRQVVERFQWPLFLTLTMKNVDDLSLGAVRDLRRAFGKLRHRKFWKAHTVGGLACIEVTNIGNGWHPHLHAVLDCKWLAITVPPPQRRESRESIKAKCEAAGKELERNWSRCLKQPSSSVFVKRCNAATITKEVVKYAVKGTDLLDCKEKIGDLIRALEGTRLMTTFGTVFGKKKVEVEDDECDYESPFKCCSDPQWRPGAAGTVASWGYEDLVKQGKKTRSFARDFCSCKKCQIREKLEPKASSFTGSPGGADLSEGSRFEKSNRGRSGPARGQFECQRTVTRTAPGEVALRA